MHQLRFIYNSPFKDSHSHPVHTCFAMIASNEGNVINGNFSQTSHNYVFSIYQLVLDTVNSVTILTIRAQPIPEKRFVHNHNRACVTKDEYISSKNTKI